MNKTEVQCFYIDYRTYTTMDPDELERLIESFHVIMLSEETYRVYCIRRNHE